MQNITLAFVVCLLLGNKIVLHAQGQASTNANYFVKHYSQNEGLIGAGGYLIRRDSRGFLWIGGFEGISRFDGRSFTNFSTKDGLYENSVSDIKEDTTGQIYTATTTGLYRYTNNAMHPFAPYYLQPKLLSINLICAIDSNTIYIADDLTDRLYLFTNKKLIPVDGFKGHANYMERDNSGYLYIITDDNHLYAIKGLKVVQKTPAPQGQSHGFRSWLKKNNTGKIIFTSNKLLLLNGAGPFTTPYVPKPIDASYYNYWVMLGSELGQIFKNISNNWQFVLSINTKVDVNSELLSDAKGNFDFITTDGLYHYYPQLYSTANYNPLIYYFTTSGDGKRVLRHDSTLIKNPLALSTYLALKKDVNSIFLAHDKTVWICTDKGAFYLPQGNGPVKHFAFEGIYSNATFKAAQEDTAGRIWLETYYGILCYEAGKFKHWSKKNGLPDDAMYASAVDKNNIYYATGRGLYAWVNGEPKNLSEELGIGRKNILSVAPDKSGDLWVCPNDYILYKIGTKGNGHFFLADSVSLDVNGKPIVASGITFDLDGNLWVVSYGRVTVYLKLANGSFSNAKKLVLGKDQNLQIITAPRTRIFTNAKRDTVYIMHDTALGIFDVKTFIAKYKSDPPKVFLTTIKLNRQETNWATQGIKVNEYGLPINPLFNSKQNTISFTYTAIVTSEPDEVVYCYKLSGLDTGWSPATKSGEVDYTNLSPGEYTFYIKAANINGQWSLPKSYAFTILTPWYLTWAALAMWFVVCIGLVLFLFSKYLKVIKHREKVERLIVEEKLKALRAQINPHFLQNTFSFLSDMLDKQPIKNTKQIIDQLSTYLRSVLYYSNETIINLEKELAFSEEYLAINKLLFNNRFSYKIDISDDVDIFAIKSPSLLLQPLLENAIKHGIRHVKADAKAIINLKVYSDGDFVYCVIGNSIGEEIDNNHFKSDYKPHGLSITEQRLALLYNKNKSQSYISALHTADWHEVVIKISI